MLRLFTRLLHFGVAYEAKSTERELPSSRLVNAHWLPATADHFTSGQRQVNIANMSAPGPNEQSQQAAAPAPAAPVAAAPAEAPRPAVAADDNLACQWDKCAERCTSAEALFVSQDSPLSTVHIEAHWLLISRFVVLDISWHC